MSIESFRMALAGGAVMALCGTAGAQLFHRVIGFPTFECAYSVENCAPFSGDGLVTVGRISTSTTAPRDMYTVRYDPTGLDIWSKVIGSANNMDDVAYSVRQTADGGFIIAAESNSISPSLGIGLVRLSAAGGMMWSQVYAGTPFADFPSGTKVRELDDGTFTVIGRYKPGPFLQGRIMHVSPFGVPIWGQTYSLSGVNADVSFTDLRPVISSTGALTGYFVSGWIKEAAAAQRSALILRIDPVGTPLAAWQYSLPGWSITADGLTLRSGRVHFSGRRSLSPTGPATGTVIVSVSSGTGGVVWAKQKSNFKNGFAAVAHDSSGAVLVGGTVPSNGDIGLLKLAGVGGAPIFANSYDAIGEGHDAIAMPGLSVSYVLTGLETMAPFFGGQDVGLIRTNAAGDPDCQWGPIPLPVSVTLTKRDRNVLHIQDTRHHSFPCYVRNRDSGNIERCPNE